MTIEQADLDAFVGRFITDLAAVAHAATVVVGDKLGLYQALAEHGPATAAELAAATASGRALPALPTPPTPPSWLAA